MTDQRRQWIVIAWIDQGPTAWGRLIPHDTPPPSGWRTIADVDTPADGQHAFDEFIRALYADGYPPFESGHHWLDEAERDAAKESQSRP